MGDVIASTILKELREFRTENDKRWEQNDKRWEENDKRWEQNEKRWEENDKRWEQNEKRWEQNEKRWEENDKRWEQNEKRWEENDKRWEQNDKRWEQNEKRWKENDKCWEENNKRLVDLEEGRKKDRIDLLNILDTMEKNISNQFSEMKEYFDAKFEKVFVSQGVNDIEHGEFRKLVYTHENRLNFYNSRINRLEEWKNDFDMGEFTAV